VILHLDKRGGGTFLAAHLTDFESLGAARRWRRKARRQLPGAGELVFAKAMMSIGSSASAGFGAGAPDLRRQVLLTAWRGRAGFLEFSAGPLVAELDESARYSWWVLFEIASSRGSHLGAKPLAPGADTNGPFAALTLGRTRPRSLIPFLREGGRLAPIVRAAPGLVTAFSAGIPLSGNCTVSIWDSQESMVAFAYRDAAGHSATTRRVPPILREQLNARMRVRDLGGDWGPETIHGERLQRLVKGLAAPPLIQREARPRRTN
jgi:hypothetical protein